MQETSGPAAGWTIRALILDLMAVLGMKATKTMDPKTATQLVVDDTGAESKKLEAAHECACDQACTQPGAAWACGLLLHSSLDCSQAQCTDRDDELGAGLCTAMAHPCSRQVHASKARRPASA